jgi:plastocyanin
MAAKVTVYMGKLPDGTDIGMTFSPDPVTVAAGTTLQWNNVDDEEHTATSDTGSAESFDSGLLGGERPKSFEHTFNTKGTFNYHCEVHVAMGMTGTITVT